MFDQLRNALESVAQPKNKQPMEAYMKERFVFLGVKSPERRAASKNIIRELRKSPTIEWDFVFECYEQEEREFHYVACDYIRKVQRHLRYEDLDILKRLICSHSWWDTVDTLAIEVGAIGLKEAEIRSRELKQWIYADNLWLRRTSIIHQLKYKDSTNLHFLKEAILANNASQEFFINKAIGWALRTYSSTDPKWVMGFCDQNNLRSLSKREALRKIKP